jgi:hypothetical protein
MARETILEARAKSKPKMKIKITKGKVAHLLSQMATRLVLPTFG